MRLIKKEFSQVDVENLLHFIEQENLCSACTILDSSSFDDENATTYICLKPKKVYKMLTDGTVYENEQIIGASKAFLFDTMRSDLAAYQLANQETGFIGGFVGYVAYDALPHFLHIPIQQNTDVPVIEFRLYEQVLKVEETKATLFSISGEFDVLWERMLASHIENKQEVEAKFSDAMENESSYTTSLNEDTLKKAVEITQSEIEQGNVYQLNLTRRLSKVIEEPNSFLMTYYQTIRQRNRAPYGMFYGNDSTQLQFASSSPEQFFKVVGNQVTTKPIKGTRPRKNNLEKDQKMREELATSTKDHAELLMITDLLRNDLNCVVENQSVSVEKFAEVVANPTVFHLVSTIHATLPPHKDAFDVMNGLFPGGSITGAPKKAAVEKIDQLETAPRGLYTGTAGYFSVNGDADFNILIRTLFQKRDTIEVHVGGGIVYESVPQFEYLETQQKAKAILAVIAEVEQ